VKRTARAPGTDLPIIRELSFLKAACATSWPQERRLRGPPHLREHSFGRDKLPTLDSAVGLGDGLIEVRQLLGRELDLLVLEAVGQVLDQLGALVGRHLEDLLEHGFDRHGPDVPHQTGERTRSPGRAIADATCTVVKPVAAKTYSAKKRKVQGTKTENPREMPVCTRRWRGCGRMEADHGFADGTQ
jgi:hypothetical protein